VESPANRSASENLRAHLCSHGRREAWWIAGVSACYDDLLAAADQAEAVLVQAGVQMGAVVALDMEFGMESAARWLALLKVRAATAVVPSGCADSDARVKDSYATWRWEKGAALRRLSGAGDHPLLAGLRAAKRSGLVLFTGGTTGRPKAVLHDADEFIAARIGGGARDYRLLSIMPMAHVGGLDALVRLWWAGATLVVTPSRAPIAVARAMVDGRADVLVTTPSFLNLFCLTGPVCIVAGAGLKVIALGAELLAPDLLRRMRQCWPRANFRQRFGATEAGVIVVRGGAETGFLIDSEKAEHRVVDGELWVRARGQMLGYLNRAESGLTADGWYATDDRVEVLSGGFLRVLGRKNQVINVGGLKVSPEEVEGALSGVAGVAVLRAHGEPHTIMGQAVTLEVVAVEGVDQAGVRMRLRAEAARTLASYQRPVAIRFVDNLSVTAAGKTDRK
jgi:acyl-coenzyme A synthetase/AMP-(fatty) acid ligase